MRVSSASLRRRAARIERLRENAVPPSSSTTKSSQNPNGDEALLDPEKDNFEHEAAVAESVASRWSTERSPCRTCAWNTRTPN